MSNNTPLGYVVREIRGKWEVAKDDGLGKPLRTLRRCDTKQVANNTAWLDLGCPPGYSTRHYVEIKCWVWVNDKEDSRTPYKIEARAIEAAWNHHYGAYTRAPGYIVRQDSFDKSWQVIRDDDFGHILRVGCSDEKVANGWTWIDRGCPPGYEIRPYASRESRHVWANAETESPEHYTEAMAIQKAWEHYENVSVPPGYSVRVDWDDPSQYLWMHNGCDGPGRFPTPQKAAAQAWLSSAHNDYQNKLADVPPGYEILPRRLDDTGLSYCWRIGHERGERESERAFPSREDAARDARRDYGQARRQSAGQEAATPKLTVVLTKQQFDDLRELFELGLSDAEHTVKGHYADDDEREDHLRALIGRAAEVGRELETAGKEYRATQDQQ